MASPVSPDSPIPPEETAAEPAESTGEEGSNDKSMYKGRLAVSVAATLGVMVYYAWREKRMEKNDPEEYARLQRLKASIRAKELDKEKEQREKKQREK